MYQRLNGLTRVNFDIENAVHKKFKTVLASQGKTTTQFFTEIIDRTIAGKEFAFETNGNPGTGQALTEERIAEIFKAKMTEVLEGIKEDEDPENKVYKTKPMDEKPAKNPGKKPVENPTVEPLEEHTVEPVVPLKVEKPKAEKPVLVEKSAEIETAVVAENGVVAVGKKVAVIEKVAVSQRTFFDWFCDGGNPKKE